ncbi:hypothetical protein [Nocardioides sp. SR21]|uniref:hypothetical protein n=1 Tax=Nocardioides sp. SR21 TaxID=2919501 RepID=UPI001FAA8A39|nr:hypothetical protein [Nocardioides sp. SR21]
MSELDQELRGTWTSRAIARSGAGGLLYGAIVTGAVLVVSGTHHASMRTILAAWAFVLVTYWLAHVYVHTTQSQFEGDHRNFVLRSLSAMREELSVLAGGVPGMAVFLIVYAGGEDTVAAAKVAIYFTVLILAIVGYLGGRHAGRSQWAALGEAAGAALLGGVLVVAKILLH